jgi:hypothetical protein
MKAEWTDQDGAILAHNYDREGFHAYIKLDIPPHELLSAVSKGEIQSFRFRLTDALLEFASSQDTWLKLMPQLASLGRKR